MHTPFSHFYSNIFSSSRLTNEFNHIFQVNASFSMMQKSMKKQQSREIYIDVIQSMWWSVTLNSFETYGFVCWFILIMTKPYFWLKKLIRIISFITELKFKKENVLKDNFCSWPFKCTNRNLLKCKSYSLGHNAALL